ncbi:hypothetical protein QBC38DRAFT_478866 [Podospora fimiseda]|uniref:Uncharacterized protein n=1 Tax=Podospora fimiseda TaxID=252190 RepID=A0AAN7BPE3_9PEZI|nr:hypothetical protein QBC38DRAFT_478866 [Podospora fimiseda]
MKLILILRTVMRQNPFLSLLNLVGCSAPVANSSAPVSNCSAFTDFSQLRLLTDSGNSGIRAIINLNRFLTRPR